MITGTTLERYFRVNPETGVILRGFRSRLGERWTTAGYIKPGGRASGGGYRIISVPGKRNGVRAHHLVWCWAYGEWPDGYEVDHEDGNRDNNSISNLRRATVSENRTNKTIQSNSSSGFKWVYRDSQRPGKWRAEVVYRDENGLRKRFQTVCHSTPDTAYEIASSFAKSAHGTFYNSGKRGE